MTGARARNTLAAVLVAAVFVLLIALGVWQLQRRSWKLALIEHTERQLAAPPVAAPGPPAWPQIGADATYRRVIATGRYRRNADTLVQAVTEFGGGFWVLTPLDVAGGYTILINRGFIPPTLRGTVPPPSGEQRIVGLLRMTEPGGAFLRHNDPIAGRWYSRDVAVIASSRHLGRTAPYFIDASEPKTGWPRGGLTVVRFRNTHLVYALTWFALAAMIAFMAARVARRPFIR